MYQNITVQTTTLASSLIGVRDDQTYLVFQLNDYLFALNVTIVTELFMSSIQTDTGSPQFLFEGNDVTLYDITQYLGLASSPHHLPQNAVICSYRSRMYAFNINKISKIHHIDDENIYYPPISCSPLITGVFPIMGQAAYVVNHADLFECFERGNYSGTSCKYEMKPIFSDL